MPFFAHDDIFTEHRRAERIVCQGKNPLTNSSYGVRSMEAFFTGIFTPFVTCDNLAQIHTSSSDVDNLNRMLFFFKIPYLLFEIAYWWLMWKLFKKEDESSKKKAAIFLALNPVVIYAIYMFGRFEPYNLFLSSLALYFLFLYDKKNKYTKIALSAIPLAIVLIFRLSYLIIIPAFFLSFIFSLKQVLTAVGSFLIAFGALKLIPFLLKSTDSLLPESQWVSKGIHPNYFFQGGIDTGSNILYLFFLIIGIVFVFVLEKHILLKKISKVELFSLLSATFFLSYYATSSFHPQYLSWLMPFMLVLITRDKSNFLWKSFWISLPFYLVYVSSWGNAVTFGLAKPVSMVFGLIQPKWFFPVLEFSKWANIGKTLFSAFCLYWIYYLLKTYAQKN